MDNKKVNAIATLATVFKVGVTDTDPTTVTFEIKGPTLTPTTYVYGTDAELVKDSTGNYHVAYTPTLPGYYRYTFTGTGACVAVDTKDFIAGDNDDLIVAVSGVLEDTSNTLFSTTIVNDSINQAIITSAPYRPYKNKVTATLAAASTDCDISDLMGLISVEKAEYKISQTPKCFRNVSRWGNALTIETDLSPAAGDTAYLYCNMIPVADTLELEVRNLIIDLAAGLAALNHVGEGRTQIAAAVAALADVNTAIDLLSGDTGDIKRAITDIASIRTALTTMTGAAITDHLTEIDTELDLAKTDIADARTAFKTAADISATAASIAAMAARLQQAIDDLAAGRALVNTIVTGAGAQSQFAGLASGEMNAATAKFREAQAFMQKQSNLANQLYNAANHEINLGAGYAAEVRTKMSLYINQMNELGAAASRELSVAQSHLALAGGYLREINARVSVANSIMQYSRWGQGKINQAMQDLKRLQRPQVFTTYPRS